MKKEQYYNADTIDKQAQSFLDKTQNQKNNHGFQINPAKVALLVIDMQDFFVSEESHAYVPSVEAVIPTVLKLQNLCLKNKIPVIQTRHINTKENAGMMAKWWGDLLQETDPASKIISQLTNPDVIQLNKTQYDAFYNSELESVLKDNKIEQLIITGVMTHLCCETTARSAFVRGYEVFFAIEGTATYNSELHLGSLVGLSHGFAVPMLSDEIVQQLSNEAVS